MGGIVKKATVLGSMSAMDRWPCFCELTSFGVQKATSAAIVAEEKSRVEMVPYSSFLAFASKNREAEVSIYHMICVNLARLLRGLHLRELSVTTLTKSYSAHQINQEAAICSWPAAIKGKGTAGVFSKVKGFFILSRNYVTFVRQKAAEKRGVVSDLAESEENVIISVKDIQGITNDKERIIIEDTQKQKLIVHLLNSNSVRTVLGILSTARDSLHGEGEIHAPIASGMVGGSVFTKVDLEILSNTFGCRTYLANDVIQSFDSPVQHVSYVIQGHCRVFVPLMGGSVVELLPVGEGETFGEIGVLLQSPSSAHVVAGDSGCTVLQIPGSFLFDEEADLDLEFLGGVFLSLMSLMWRRILNVEANQIEIWRRNVEGVE